MPTSDLDNALAAQAFSAMGSEARVRVVRTLVRAGPEGLSIGDIQKRLDIPASTLAHHLRFLAAGGVIEQEKQGRTVINRANYDHIRDLADFLVRECCADCAPCDQTEGGTCGA
ncbi:MAG: ArsR/SmtB family transcription factor [Gammaproteobacteria bacterium]